MTDKARRVVEGAEIPSVPHVLQAILALTSDPASSSRELEERILTEPGLVAHLLKTVNSAYFGLPRKVASISQAIILLGFTSVRSIASGLILVDAFNHLPHLTRRYVLTVWTHSLACAGLTRILAGTRPRKKQDELFLAAMVHNVGHLVLAQYFHQKYDELAKVDPLPSVEEERRRFEVDHAEVGAALLEEWKFTKDITDLVGTHHQPESFKGEAMDINTLVVSEALSRKGANLKACLEQKEADVDVGILTILTALGWKWKDLQERKEAISRSIEAAQQIIKV
jgi:HD-like signal output (HDOD) protein